MRRSLVALAALPLLATTGPAAADPLPTETRYIYVDLNYTAVLVGPNTVRLTYRCATTATMLGVAAGVTCGSATASTLFLPGAYATVARTEEVPATAVSVSVTGTGVFADGRILTVTCSTDNVLEPYKYVACDRGA